MVKNIVILTLLFFDLNSLAFEGQKQQQAAPIQRVSLQLPQFDNGAACPISIKLQNDLFMQEIMPHLHKFDDSNPMALYNSLNAILPFFTLSKKTNVFVKQYFKENRARININVTDVLGQTALHYAAMQKNHQLAMLLISLGADVNTQTSLNVPITEEFASPSEKGAALYKYLPTLKKSFLSFLYLGQEDVRYFIDNFTPMHFAILNNDREMIGIFVKFGFKIPESPACIEMVEPPTGDFSFIDRAEFCEIIPQIIPFLKAHANLIRKYVGNYKTRKGTLKVFDIIFAGFDPERSSIENLILEYTDYNSFQLVYSQKYLDAYRKSLNE